MRILVICADASSNSLVRVYPIAKVLQRNHEVAIAGFRSGDSLFAPYADEFEYQTQLAQPLPKFISQVRSLVRSFDADIIYAFKPLSTSLWPGLAAQRRFGIPLIVDVEDWELGWFLDGALRDQLSHLRMLRRPNEMFWTAVNELLVRRADHRFVVSSFLQRRFGGTVLVHGPDTDRFTPERWDRAAALQELGLPDQRYILFAGSPMPDKGLEDVLTAVERLNLPDLNVLLVGSARHDPTYRQRLIDRFGRIMKVVGPRPHREMPLFLAASNFVVLAQRPSRETAAQVPGKVFEAMAMGLPILATPVSDLPTILDGAGVMIKPQHVDDLTEKLEHLVHDEPEQRRLGTAARERCVNRYSWDAMERILQRDLSRLDGSGRG